MSHTIEIPVREQHDYRVTIGRDLWGMFESYVRSRFSCRRAAVAVDSRVEDLHGEEISGRLDSIFDTVDIFVVPEGESSKSLDQWNKMVDFLLQRGIERSTPFIAIGGGVTGDLAGFTASAVLRGIPLIHLPTTLLAMVDSSIGGKTGVNHDTGKNLIGAFYQPDRVFADVAFLETLEDPEWVNGLSEILKYGAISSPDIIEQTRSLVGNGFNVTPEWNDMIAKCASIKAEFVQKDTLESGSRAYLNFGHTFGHALEKTTGYGSISHGEAVFVGMVAAVYASEKLGAEIGSARFEPFRTLYSLNADDLGADSRTLIEAMKTDKKVKEGKIRLVLLKNWGEPFIYEDARPDLLEAAWDFALNKFR